MPFSVVFRKKAPRVGIVGVLHWLYTMQRGILSPVDSVAVLKVNNEKFQNDLIVKNQHLDIKGFLLL